MMGSKIAARALAQRLAVPTLTGTEEPIANREEALKIARGIGFPLMIKAAFGGGGRVSAEINGRRPAVSEANKPCPPEDSSRRSEVALQAGYHLAGGAGSLPSPNLIATAANQPSLRLRMNTLFRKAPTKILVLIVLGVVAWLDFATGFEVSVFFLYVFPVAWATWSLGLASGLFTALLCAGAARWADFADRDDGSNPPSAGGFEYASSSCVLISAARPSDPARSSLPPTGLRLRGTAHRRGHTQPWKTIFPV